MFKTYSAKTRVSVQTRVMGNSNALFKMAESLYTLKYSDIHIFIFLRVRMEINLGWQ